MFFFFCNVVETGICDICVFTKSGKELSSNLASMDPRSQGKRGAKNRYFSPSESEVCFLQVVLMVKKESFKEPVEMSRRGL
jgi:hypothetical protein